MKFARVEEGVVVEVVDLPDGWIPGVNVYHPDVARTFHAVPSGREVVEGWTFNGTNFSSPKTARSREKT